MYSICSIDLETRSSVNLLTQGVYNYAQGDDTDILCMAYAFDDGPVQVWTPGQPFPADLSEFILRRESRSLAAWNAGFERLLFKYVITPRYGCPAIDLGQWICTATQFRARALPGKLEDAARCVGAKFQKDKRGTELIKALSIPQADGTFNDDPALMAEMIEYNIRDVEVERTLRRLVPPLSDREHRDYVMSELINDTGLLVDVNFARAAVGYADAEMAEICARLEEVTKGRIKTPKQFQALKDLMLPFMEADDRIRKAMTVVRTDRREGTETRKIVLDKDARSKLLAIAADEPEFLPADVVEVLELTDAAGKSSVSKFGNMVLRAGADGRVRGAYIASGAGQTGRFSSVGLQLHNFGRACADDPAAMRSRVLAGEPLDNVMADLASMLRPAIQAAPGNILVWGDWSAIEARVLPWLGGGEEVLEIFRRNDADPDLPDIYKVEAAALFGVSPYEVTKDQRAVGKVEILSCGYQGSVRAFQAMARAYKVVVPDARALEIVHHWRGNNPWAPLFWRALEKAVKEAMRYPGVTFEAGRLVYCRPTSDSPLYCQLPSGRVLSYPQPIMETVDGPFGQVEQVSAIKAQWKPKQGESEWGRIQLYGGLLAENATQAMSADILRDALAKLVQDEWIPVGHTHDEVILEVTEAEERSARAELAAVMLEVPEWAPGLPLACEITSGKVYSK